MNSLPHNDEEEQEHELTTTQFDRLNAIVKLSLWQMTMKEDVQCLPIIYLPLNTTTEEILVHIESAQILVPDRSVNSAKPINQYKG